MRAERERRHRLAESLAAPHGGVLTRRMLAHAGLTRGQVQTEVDHGVWRVVGWHTLCIGGRTPVGEGRWWWALWESGVRSALDGTTALLAAGLSGCSEDVIHISVPNDASVRALPGVRHHRLRALGPVVGGGLRRTRAEVAAVRAAQWASTDRQAATLLAMAVQQRLAAPERLLGRWGDVRWTPRRELLDGVIGDVCDGAHSLSELDFARLCRRRRLPEPTRQAVRTLRTGRVFLDADWDEQGLHVEIQGAHHFSGTAGIDDALRFNEIGLARRGTVSLQIPVLGLRTCPDRFLDQVERALATLARRRSA